MSSEELHGECQPAGIAWDLLLVAQVSQGGGFRPERMLERLIENREWPNAA